QGLRVAHVPQRGCRFKKTLRSSIWQRSHICTNHQKCWQLRFHQGTPVKDVQEEGQARKMAN
ncbi:hypothetical protein ELD68_32890, partial [Klebsiella pneumoniae]|nr:hypothetical protein [Klebsiella pneumoniae]